MDDLLDHTLDIAVALGIIEGTKRHGTLPVLGVRLEDRPMTLTLTTDDTTLHTSREV